MSKKNLIIFLVLAPMLALVMSGAQVYYAIYIWTFKGEQTTFTIRPGETFGSINYRLDESKIIYSSRLFHRFAKFNGKMTSFKAGQYSISSGMTMVNTLDLLTSGKSITTKVTIPEGRNLFQIGEILESKGITKASDFIKYAKDKTFVQKLGIPSHRAEGYLYPDTYSFQENTPAPMVIKTMVSLFKRKMKTVDFSQSKLNKHEIVILASVVEKETGAKFERPAIAGVFHNRLKKRMRLQSDPTTIYGIYETYNGNLRKKHLLQKTPYNTYKISGLPVGPISNPGLESIKAVLSPDNHNYLYFVSKNDGTHIFSKTYADHRRAVNKWQKNRKNREGKSWRNLKQ